MSDNTKPQSKQVACHVHGVSAAYGAAGGERCLRCAQDRARARKVKKVLQPVAIKTGQVQQLLRDAGISWLMCFNDKEPNFRRYSFIHVNGSDKRDAELRTMLAEALHIEEEQITVMCGSELLIWINHHVVA